MEKETLIDHLKKLLEWDNPELISNLGVKYFLLSEEEIRGVIDILENN